MTELGDLTVLNPQKYNTGNNICTGGSDGEQGRRVHHIPREGVGAAGAGVHGQVWQPFPGRCPGIRGRYHPTRDYQEAHL